MARPRVLVVDDDPVLVEALASILRGRYDVATAANGSQALAAVRREPPDLVILDVMMDHMSEGFDVARTLRGDDATSLIPIIILTGVDRVYNLRMEIDESWVPADRYLEKPMLPDDLLAAVADLIGPGTSDEP
ncbi:MAG: response regulator [Holophagae bacterium]|jgi:CheY-like chemotaxis protein